MNKLRQRFSGILPMELSLVNVLGKAAFFDFNFDEREWDVVDFWLYLFDPDL